MKRYEFTINGKNYSVGIESIEDGVARLNVNGRAIEALVASGHKDGIQQTHSQFAVSGPDEGEARPASFGDKPSSVKTPSVGKIKPSGVSVVSSPLPGVILSVKVAAGDNVKAGQTLAVLEAMKMENDIEAEKDGTVTAVHVQKGDSVLEGAAIVSIE